MVADGLKSAGGLLLGAVIVGYLANAWVAAPLVVLALFCLWFFRDPDRVIPEGDVAVSPADGKVVLVKPMPDGRMRVSIFLNIFDVHVNRSPIGGVVRSVSYQPGKFVNAAFENASTENEQNTLIVEADNGSLIEFSQIAGLIARRIVCYKKPGDRIKKGERIGLIKFGSRMDVHFGSDWRVSVRAGERVSAGSSILPSSVPRKQEEPAMALVHGPA